MMKFASFAILLLAVVFAGCQKTEVTTPEAVATALGTPKTTTLVTELTITDASLVLVSETGDLTVELQYTITGFTSRAPQTMGMELCRGTECYQQACVLQGAGGNNSWVYKGTYTFTNPLEIGEALAVTPTPPYTTRPRSRVLNVQGGTDSH